MLWVGVNILSKQCHKEPTRVGPPAWGFGRGVTTPHRKNYYVTEHFTKPRTRTDLLARRQQWKIYTRLIKLYEAMILRVVLHERETWSVTVREERTQKVFANRVLRMIFGL
jgi:hypothetical protein